MPAWLALALLARARACGDAAVADAAAAVGASGRAGTCAPAGHAVLIMSSAAHAPLLDTFGAGLRAGNGTCLLPVLLVACLDEACLAACASALPGARCVLVPPCDTRELATFYALTAHRYAVYAAVLEALPRRGGLLALDDDLLVLKPPFTERPSRGCPRGSHSLPSPARPAARRHQADTFTPQAWTGSEYLPCRQPR